MWSQDVDDCPDVINEMLDADAGTNSDATEWVDEDGDEIDEGQ